MNSGILRNTYFSTINIYFEYLIGLVISILIARSLGPSDYGVYSYLVKVAGIAIIITNAGINTGAIKFIAEARAREQGNQIAAIYAFFSRIQRIKTLLVTGALLAFSWLAPGMLIEEQYQPLVYCLLLAIVFKSAHMFRVGVFKGFERFDLLAFSVLVVAPLNLAGIAIAVYYELNLFVFYGFFALMTCLYWLVSGWYLRRIGIDAMHSPGILDPELKRRMSSHLKIVSVNTIVGGLILGQCEVLLLKHMVSNESVAFFNIANVISGAALLLVPGVYSAVLFPVIARSVADVRQDPGARIRESTRYLFVLGLLVAVPTFYFAEDIVVLMYGEEFSQAGIVLGLFTLVGIFKAFREPASAYLLSSDRQMTMLKLSFVIFGISIVTNILAIHYFDLAGAVFAFCFVSAVFAAVLMYLIYSLLGVVPEWKKLMIGILSAIVAMLPVVWLSDSLPPIVDMVVGFIAFGVLFPLVLILLNGLSESDYGLLEKYSQALGRPVHRLVTFLIDRRIRL